MRNAIKLITIVLFQLSISKTSMANNLFIYDFYNKIEMNEITQNNKISELECIKGKTYSLINNLNIKTTTNSFASYVFPNLLSIYQGASSETYFNFDSGIIYTENFELPSVLKIKEIAFNFSFDGELYCVSESTNHITVSTTVCNVIFDTAKVFLKSGGKYTHIYVHEGSAVVFDNKSKRKKELKSGDYCVVTPRPLLNPREASGIVLSGNVFSGRVIEDDEKSVYNQQMQSLKNQLDDILFVGFDKTNIFGVKLKR